MYVNPTLDTHAFPSQTLSFNHHHTPVILTTIAILAANSKVCSQSIKKNYIVVTQNTVVVSAFTQMFVADNKINILKLQYIFQIECV